MNVRLVALLLLVCGTLAAAQTPALPNVEPAAPAIEGETIPMAPAAIATDPLTQTPAVPEAPANPSR